MDGRAGGRGGAPVPQRNNAKLSRHICKMSTPAAATVTYPAAYRPRHPVRRLIGAAVWLIVLGHPIKEAFLRHGGWGARTLVILIVSAFCLGYITILVSGFEERANAWIRVGLFAAESGLAVALCVAAGESGLSAVIFIGVAAAVLFRRRAGIGLAGLAVLAAAVTPWLVPGWKGDESYALSAALASMAGFAFVNLVRRNKELVAAREEVIRLTAAEERLRIARDIHDVLGQHLTAITVKSQLAGRLLRRSPERAGRELAEIERLSRAALSDVRAAVSGYRKASLHVELAAARQLLEAAGIAYDVPEDAAMSLEGLPAEHQELFAWAIREGVTNVVRHSGARTCKVTIGPHTVEVADDGVYDGKRGDSFGASYGALQRSGSGLAGLRERVNRAGGRLTAGGRDGGGFLLRLELTESGAA
jgi:two-component system, NarL family, sensor histidine kinase DesK